ncbi:ribonuclease P protein subunit p25-like protein [Dendronephthya gigantea]|uniref:ribonuclease P protein subunit p25-like protein n=1 Tax=Dendronephthya gigantea TaxID=151771 RepID=UPI00106AF718|nr:ribonuclease P protein subunit p25-like protein [Dendronephthya gigantea]XP_028395394.1 ribonuclease P protein subunit p25-like protein [Dendronephthya gigantea]XP_028395403.1 ribonuclease P protein subunit p25-like protein [Dendronephthya gigantea]
MEHYKKLNSRPVVEDPKEPWDVYVGSGSKVKAVISKALKILNENGEKVVLIGFGPTLNKAITCVEIIKRKEQDLHQNNKLFYKKMEDTWEPNQEGLDRLTVSRNVPAIKIVLSRIPLNVNEPGYQAPVSVSKKKTLDYRKQRAGYSAKGNKETTEKKHGAETRQRNEHMSKTKRFKSSQH